MKVHVYAGDAEGCGHFRTIWPARAMRAKGHDVRLFMPGEPTDLKIMIHEEPTGERWITMHERPECDVLVIQRPLDWKWVTGIPELKRLGIKVVVDMDDDTSALRGDHHLFWAVHPRTSPDENYKHVEAAVKHADVVTVTTKALAKKYGHGREVIIPNCLPDAYYKTSSEKPDELSLGWTGVANTHPGDLNVVGPAVRNAMKASGARFRTIGDGAGLRSQLGLVAEPDVVWWKAIDEYPEALSRLAHVGIVPLAYNTFNDAKSWLKGLEYAAVGMPFVASATDQYKLLAAEGAGIIVDKPKEWERALRNVLGSASMRDEMAAAGRETAERWSMENNIWRWEEAWLQ